MENAERRKLLARSISLGSSPNLAILRTALL